MKVAYDEEFDILDVSIGKSVDGSSLEDHTGVAVHFGTDGGTDIVAATVLGASFEFKNNYDETSDTWFLGDTDSKTSKITTNDDFLGYWPPEYEEDDLPVPVGFALLNASKHLAGVRRQLIERRATTTKQPQI